MKDRSLGDTGWGGDPPLPIPSPTVHPETQRFWDEAARGALVLPRCDLCQAVTWYPRSMCGECGSDKITWFEASGVGNVYSFTICRRGVGPYANASPFVIAFVELDEGPRIMSNIVESDPEVLRVGQRVEVVFSRSEQGHALPRFRAAKLAKSSEI